MFNKLSYLEMQKAGWSFSSPGLRKTEHCRAFDLHKRLSPPQRGRLLDPSLQTLLHQIFMSTAWKGLWTSLSLFHCGPGALSPQLSVPLSVSHRLCPRTLIKCRTFLRDSLQFFPSLFLFHSNTRLWLDCAGSRGKGSPLPAPLSTLVCNTSSPRSSLEFVVPPSPSPA